MSDPKVVAVQRAWAIAMRDLGVEPVDVLRRASLPDSLFAREGARISIAEFFRLWQAFADDVPHADFPIRLAESLAPEAFDPVVFAALCSPDMGVAVQRIARYKRLSMPMTLTAVERPEGLYVQKAWDDVSLAVPPTLAATDLTFLTQIARLGTRRRILPLRVTMTCLPEPVEPYGAFFGVRPELGQHNALVFGHADAALPFVTASASLWKTFEPELQRRLAEQAASVPIARRVRSVLLETLPSGDASIQAAARRLGLTPRTLQRRLKPEGTSFKEIVRGTREALARHYLTRTELAYAEISFLVGFEDPSSFFRAFREWTGTTPQTMRLSAG